MTTLISRRSWLRNSAMAAAVLPISRWYMPEYDERLDRYPDAEKVIKLNSNENAYGPSEAAKKAVIDSLSQGNRYPWAAMGPLREAIAEREGLTAAHVYLSAGSTELLGLAGLAFGLHGGELVACHPTFDFMMVYAERLGCRWSRTPLDSQYQYDLNALERASGADTRLIFVCNPNNPTGIEIPNQSLRAFCEAQAKHHPVYVDEAYVELSPQGRKSSMVDLVDRYPNLMIGRTFSKVFGLAGMRIGYALAHPDTIKKLSGFHTGRGTTLSSTGVAAALACLKDTEFETFSRDRMIEGRNQICQAFDTWGVEYMPSATNFVYFKNDQFTEDPVPALERDRILVRSYGYMPGWTRVSIGTIEETKLFIDTLGKYRA